MSSLGLLLKRTGHWWDSGQENVPDAPDRQPLSLATACQVLATLGGAGEPRLWGRGEPYLAPTHRRGGQGQGRLTRGLGRDGADISRDLPLARRRSPERGQVQQTPPASVLLAPRAAPTTCHERTSEARAEQRPGREGARLLWPRLFLPKRTGAEHDDSPARRWSPSRRRR